MQKELPNYIIMQSVKRDLRAERMRKVKESLSINCESASRSRENKAADYACLPHGHYT